MAGRDPMSPEARARHRVRMQELWRDPTWRASRKPMPPHTRRSAARRAREALVAEGRERGVPTVGPAEVLIRDLNLRPLFVLCIYGADADALTTVAPADWGLGGNLVAAALRRRGIHPASVSFNLFDVNVGGGRRSPLWER